MGLVCPSLEQPLEGRSDGRRNRSWSAILAIDENMNEMTLRQRFAAVSEQSDFVADTRISDPGHPESGTHLFGKGDRIQKTATGFSADPDRLPGMNVQVTFADKPGVDHSVEE